MGNGGAKQGHDAIAQDLVDGALVAMHGVHHASRAGSRSCWAASGSRSRDQFRRAFEVGKQHRDLFALAFQGAAGGENFLGEIGRGVGEGCRGGVAHGCWSSGCTQPHRSRPALRPSSSTASRWPLMSSTFRSSSALVIELELPLEGPIGHAAPLAQQGNHLIHHRDKVHPLSSLPGARPPCSCATPS